MKGLLLTATCALVLIAGLMVLQETRKDCRYFAIQAHTICSDDMRYASALTVEARVSDNSELERIYAAANK